jgi:DNA-binding NtrC family response regulator
MLGKAADKRREGSVTRRILVIANDSTLALSYERALCPAGYAVDYYDHPAAGVRAAIAGGFDVILVGETTPELETLAILREIKSAKATTKVVIVSRDATVEAAVAAMKEGAADYLREPCSAEELRSVIDRFAEPPAPDTAVGAKAIPPDWSQGFEGMLSQCPAMWEIFALVRRIAPIDSTVLVTGESGTGKEMVAGAIHRHSPRRDCPLLACDCTALAPTLLESELFGHAKGSFSGAIATKQGLFEVAHQGTLLLDEVANLSLETQRKLLRVLESRKVRKVGDTVEHDIDIRLVATTNRVLAEMVKVGEFRADLYYRLNVVPILLPPLRERAGDVPLLAMVFLERFSRQMGIPVGGFSSEAMRQLEAYPWPGNVRELRNIVERLSVLYGGSCIELSHLPAEVREAESVGRAQPPRTWDELKRLKRQIIQDLERQFLIAALDRSSHNVTQAAESVGMQRPNFHALLRIHGLRPDR